MTRSELLASQARRRVDGVMWSLLLDSEDNASPYLTLLLSFVKGVGWHRLGNIFCKGSSYHSFNTLTCWVSIG